MPLNSERLSVLKSVLKKLVDGVLQDVADLRAEIDEFRVKFDTDGASAEDRAGLAELDTLLAAADPTKDAVLPSTSETQSIRARKGKERLGSVSAANEEAAKDKDKDKGH